MSGIPEEQLLRLSAFVAARMGLHFPEERRRDLERGVNSAACELDFKDSAAFVEWILSSSPTRSQIEILAGHLTVGETYFYRNGQVFQALEEFVLPELIRSRRAAGKRLRIWSAGCATGEEAYSIATVLSKLIVDLQSWNIMLLATDINPRSLRKAAEGVYGAWSFRDTAPEFKKQFFRQTWDGRFKILPHIRSMVNFFCLNLVEDLYPSIINDTNAMDVILCRNVLMYFTPERAQNVIHNFERCLVNGGWLILSPTDDARLFSRLEAVNSFGATLYRKGSGAASPNACPFRPAPLEDAKIPLAPAIEFIDRYNPGAVTGDDLAHAPAHGRSPSLPHEQSPPFAKGGRGDFEQDFKPRSIEPESGLYRQARQLYEAGCYPEAEGKANELLDRNPADARGMSLLARIYANSGKLNEALAWCEKALLAEKLNALDHYLMSNILKELGQTDAALLSLRRAVYLDPNLIAAYVSLGNITRRLGKKRESEKHLQNALSLLKTRQPGDIVPESGGITSERMIEIIERMAIA